MENCIILALWADGSDNQKRKEDKVKTTKSTKKLSDTERIEKILNYQPEWTRLIFRLDATGYPSNEKIAEVASYYHVNEKMLKQAIIKKMQSTA